jgi:hypothetical protein
MRELAGRKQSISLEIAGTSLRRHSGARVATWSHRNAQHRNAAKGGFRVPSDRVTFFALFVSDRGQQQTCRVQLKGEL